MNDRRPLRREQNSAYRSALRQHPISFVEARRLTRRNASSRILFLFIAIAFVPFGCSRGPASPAGTNTNAQRVVPSPTPSGEPGAPMRVAFSTDDDAGVQIVGDLYVPEKTPAPAVLALHQWDASRATYKDFAK